MTIDAYFERMVKSLCQLVRTSRPLVWDGEHPPAHYFDRNRAIIMLCCDGIDISKPMESLCVRGRTIKKCVGMLNGDWRKERPEHFCINGCCRNFHETENKMVKAAVDLLCLTKPPIAAAHRWGKQLPSASWWLSQLSALRRFVFAPAPNKTNKIRSASEVELLSRNGAN